MGFGSGEEMVSKGEIVNGDKFRGDVIADKFLTIEDGDSIKPRA